MSNKNDSAVAPVIAVMLIIMITIVIAAIFAVAVIGFGSNVQSGKVVGVTANSYSTDNDHGVIAQFWGGKDMDKLESVKAYIGDIQLVSKDTGTSEIYNPTVGVQYYFSTQSGYKTIKLGDRTIQLTEYLDVDTSIPQYVNFVGKFSDGSEQIIYSWQLPILAITVDPGIYLGNEYIKVVGYTNENGWKGHGLLIQTLNGATVSRYPSELFESCRLTIEGETSPITDIKKIFESSAFEKVTDNDRNSYVVAAVTTDSKMTPYNDNPSLESEITGEITIKYKVNGVEKSEKMSVTIPARVNVNPGDDYKGEIVKYVENEKSDDEIYIYLNEKSNRKSTSGTSLKDRFAIYLNDNGNRKLIYSEGPLSYYKEYFEPGVGHGIKADFNLIEYYKSHPNASLEFYVIGDQTKGSDTHPTVWYLVDSKPLSSISGIN